jgi:hypothetical protein
MEDSIDLAAIQNNLPVKSHESWCQAKCISSTGGRLTCLRAGRSRTSLQNNNERQYLQAIAVKNQLQNLFMMEF